VSEYKLLLFTACLAETGRILIHDGPDPNLNTGRIQITAFSRVADPVLF
jgi:hypothetical protein